jgi:propanediol dehydratase large subunit
MLSTATQVAATGACSCVARPRSAHEGLRAFIAVTSIAAVLLVACSSERDDWEQARKADSVEAYRLFLSKHAKSATPPRPELPWRLLSGDL